jgi:hypothetical protein
LTATSFEARCVTDNSIREFLSLVKKLLVEVRTLNFNFLRLQEKVEAISEHSKAETPDQTIPPEVSVVLAKPTAIEVNAQTREQKNFWNRLSEFLQPVGIIAVAVYAVFTYFMWREMIQSSGAAADAVVEARRNRQQAERSLTATIQQFHLEQRAWVNISIPKAIALETGKEVSFPVGFYNSGRTPAKRFELQAKLIVIPSTNTIKLTDRIDEPKITIKTNAMLPNAPETMPIYWVLPERPGELIKLDADNHRRIDAGELRVLVFGRMTYDDVYGVSHWLRFCWCTGWAQLRRIRPDESITKCEEYNDVDNK